MFLTVFKWIYITVFFFYKKKKIIELDFYVLYINLMKKCCDTFFTAKQFILLYGHSAVE